METVKERKQIGIVLLLVFIPVIINFLLSYSIQIFKLYDYSLFNSSKINYFYVITNLMTFTGFAYAAVNKKFFSNIIGYISAWVFSVLLLIFTINCLGAALNEEFNIFSFLGHYADLVIRLLYLALIVAFLIPLNTWLPIKVMGIVTQLMELIIAIQITSIRKAFECYDYEAIERLNNQIEIIGYISFAAFVATAILVVVWMCRRIKINNSLDLI